MLAHYKKACKNLVKWNNAIISFDYIINRKIKDSYGKDNNILRLKPNIPTISCVQLPNIYYRTYRTVSKNNDNASFLQSKPTIPYKPNVPTFPTIETKHIEDFSHFFVVFVWSSQRGNIKCSVFGTTNLLPHFFPRLPQNKKLFFNR